MTYNIRIGAGYNEIDRNLYELKDFKKFDLEPIIEAIRSVEPDIVGLQEVLGERQAAKLGKALDMNYAYVPQWYRQICNLVGGRNSVKIPYSRDFTTEYKFWTRQNKS